MEKFASKLAWARVAQNNNIDFEELKQVGLDEWVDKAHTFDPDKGVKESTYATTVMRNAMSNFLSKQGRMITKEQKTFDILPSNFPKPGSHLMFRDDLVTLSTDAKSVVELCLEAPQAVLPADSELQTPYELLKALRQHLLRAEWSNWKIDSTFREIRSALNIPKQKKNRIPIEG